MYFAAFCQHRINNVVSFLSHVNKNIIQRDDDVITSIH